MPNDKEKVYTIKSDIASVSTFADNIDLLYKDLKKKESSFSFGKNNYSEALKELDNLRKITRGYADKGTDLTTEELNECKRELIKVENLTDKYLNERNNSKESSRSTSMRGLKRIITDVKQGIDDEFERIEEEKYYNDENLYKNVADIDKEKIIEVVNDKLKVYHELNPNSEASGNNSFYGEKYKDHNSRVKAGDYSLNRTAGISVSILALAATGKYTVDELMDNSKLVEEKAEMFDKVATAMKNSSDPENQKWIAEQIYNGRNVTEKLIEKEAKTIDYSDPDILNNKKYCQLLHLADAQFDAWQEMAHCEKEIFELAKKDHPEMKSWKDYRDWWTERDSPLLATVQNIRILEQGFQGVLDNVDNISISILDSINMSVCAINTVNRKLNQKQKESPDVPFIEWFETNDKETLASFGAASVETIRKLKFVDDIPSMKKGFLLSSLKGKLSENIEVSIDREKMKMVVTGLPSELEIKKIIVEDNKEIGKQEKAPEVAPAVEEPKAEKAPEVAPAVEEPKAEKAPEVAPAVEEPKQEKAPEVAPAVEEPKAEKAPEVAPAAEEPKQEKAPEEAPVVEEPKQKKNKKQSEAVLLDAEDIENGEEIIDAQLAELRKLESEGKFIELIQLTSDVMRNAVKGEGKVKEENTKKNEALYPFISDYFEGGLGYGVRAIKEEKQESFEKLLEAMGYEIARNCVLVGKEITETAEKIKNGEIKGAEEFAHDPKACINIASSYVFESGSDANFNMTTPTNAFFQLFLNTDVKSSRLAGELLNKGNQTYLDSIKDENERAKAKELLELGVSAGESKISKYGLKCAYADEKKEKICIVSAEEKFAEKLKDLSSKELQKEEDKLTKIYEQSKQVKDLIPKVIKGIGENLDFLDKTNRDSHENSDEFDNMTSAMLDLYKSDTKQLTIHTFAKKVKQVRDAAAEYERTHDKWNKAFWKTGKDRLEMSKHIKEMTDLTLQAIGEVKKGGYYDEPLKGVTSILEGDIRLVGEKREKQEEKERALKDGEANNKQRRKLDIKEVRDMLKGDKKTESKRNSINKAAQKDAEIKNDTIKKSNTFTGKKN